MRARERQLRRTRWVTRGVLALGTVGALGASGAIALAGHATSTTEDEEPSGRPVGTRDDGGGWVASEQRVAPGRATPPQAMSGGS